MTDISKIIYTKTDEAPALATYSFLPIIEAYTKTANIEIELKDISLAARIIASFSEYLNDTQKQSDDLAELGRIVNDPDANIIKLPNISASIPQLLAAIKELQNKDYDIPNFPLNPVEDKEIEIKTRYLKILGSAVNPIIREGNSDRRVAVAVKQYAKDNPHSMGEWNMDSQSHVAHMTEGDFYGSEKSYVSPKADIVRIELHTDKGVCILKEKTSLLKNEIIDASLMSKKSLCAYYEKEINEAKKEGLLLSLHLKATMMKVSDPIIFGHALTVYFRDVFTKYRNVFATLGVNPNNGLGDLYSKVAVLPEEERKEIEREIENTYSARPELAMVDSGKGITNLHVPSDIIVDASMPAAIRNSGKMWGKDGQLHDTKALIPDRSYASVYQEVFTFCKKNGAFDVSSMGDVSNVGLMAKKAEEYGSHDKTFEIAEEGVVKVVNEAGDIVLKHNVESGDIWRMCQTKDEAIKDWVKLAVKRAELTGDPAIFWLDENRSHDIALIDKVNVYLKEYDITGLNIQILNPVDAVKYTLKRIKAGLDTISVTGNVLRDYLTDLFPILELGTSAKMLSIVPLLAGGGLYETGAGGSAPKHIQQFLREGHLRWDSLGEFLALAVSLTDLGMKNRNKKITTLARTLDNANSLFLKNNKSPSRKVNELDNRGSHFYLAMYWAQALAEQTEDSELKLRFTPLAKILAEKEKQIIKELKDTQGFSVNCGGYYQFDLELVSSAMRPSDTFNKALTILE